MIQTSKFRSKGPLILCGMLAVTLVVYISMKSGTRVPIMETVEGKIGHTQLTKHIQALTTTRTMEKPDDIKNHFEETLESDMITEKQSLKSSREVDRHAENTDHAGVEHAASNSTKTNDINNQNENMNDLENSSTAKNETVTNTDERTEGNISDAGLKTASQNDTSKLILKQELKTTNHSGQIVQTQNETNSNHILNDSLSTAKSEIMKEVQTTVEQFKNTNDSQIVQTTQKTETNEHAIQQEVEAKNDTHSIPETGEQNRLNKTDSSKNDTAQSTNSSTVTYTITWFHVPFWSVMYPGTFNTTFEQCEYSNCEMKIGREHAPKSDAVIFDGRMLKPEDFIERPLGQVWIFAADEAPRTFHIDGGLFSRGPWVSSFNWTMTYDKSNTDIHLPYGEVIHKPTSIEKDFKAIYEKKNKTALIVSSNCHLTMSDRVKYVSMLQKYVDMDSLGDCGTKPFTCGKRYVHDECFSIVNNYMFYLPFENAFCDHYFTEKLFENYNYDSIMVVRGGRYNDIKQILPEGTYISTDGFKSVKDLADYMNTIAGSEKLYIDMLKIKSQYYSVPRKIVYQKALCNLCERMNKQDQYRKIIYDINDWAFRRNPCQEPTDLNET